MLLFAAVGPTALLASLGRWPRLVEEPRALQQDHVRRRREFCSSGFRALLFVFFTTAPFQIRLPRQYVAGETVNHNALLHLKLLLCKWTPGIASPSLYVDFDGPAHVRDENVGDSGSCIAPV